MVSIRKARRKLRRWRHWRLMFAPGRMRALNALWRAQDRQAHRAPALAGIDGQGHTLGSAPAAHHPHTRH